MYFKRKRKKKRKKERKIKSNPTFFLISAQSSCSFCSLALSSSLRAARCWFSFFRRSASGCVVRSCRSRACSCCKMLNWSCRSWCGVKIKKWDANVCEGDNLEQINIACTQRKISVCRSLMHAHIYIFYVHTPTQKIHSTLHTHWFLLGLFIFLIFLLIISWFLFYELLLPLSFFLFFFNSRHISLGFFILLCWWISSPFSFLLSFTLLFLLLCLFFFLFR